jgi:glycosyltransferase involved in cell wall biosynthesis
MRTNPISEGQGEAGTPTAFDFGVRIALCHEWVTVWGGSELVAKHLADALNIREIFTFAAEPSLVKEMFPRHRVTCDSVGSAEILRKHWKWLLPYMSHAWSKIDLSDYQIVVTSSHSCVNSIRVPNDTLHVSYCHTPMRYAWDWRAESRRLPLPLRPLMPMAAATLRRGDVRRSRNPDVYLANSEHVSRRIARYYGREAEVVYPPVDVDYWKPGDVGNEDFFLVTGRMVAYKRMDMAIRASLEAGVRLVVAGSGPELGRLKRLAADSRLISFVHAPRRPVLRELYRKAIALINPGVEDFGIAMVEAQACGTPVVAADAGGAREAVRDGITGMLVDSSCDSLAAAIRNFDAAVYDLHSLRSHAIRFAPSSFEDRIRSVIGTAWARWNR